MSESTRTFTAESAVQTAMPVSHHLTQCEDNSNTPYNNNPSDEANNERSCWICLATDEDNRLAAWVHPCKCRGTTKWVHQRCLNRWVDEKQNGNALRTVRCQQCRTEYLMVFSPLGTIARILEGFEYCIRLASPLVGLGIIFGCLYSNALTFGVITFLQVVGHETGLALMERRAPILLLIGLPVIPVALIMGRMIRWEEAIIRLIRNRRSLARKLPLMNSVVPFPEEDEEQAAQNLATPELSGPVSPTRILCGALLLPTISSIVGRVLFESIESTMRRTLLGGLTYITVKGILKIYLKQEQYTRNKNRHIADYTEDNIRSYGNRNRNEGGNSPSAGNAFGAQQ